MMLHSIPDYSSHNGRLQQSGNSLVDHYSFNSHTRFDILEKWPSN